MERSSGWRCLWGVRKCCPGRLERGWRGTHSTSDTPPWKCINTPWYQPGSTFSHRTSDHWWAWDPRCIFGQQSCSVPPIEYTYSASCIRRSRAPIRAILFLWRVLCRFHGSYQKVSEAICTLIGRRRKKAIRGVKGLLGRVLGSDPCTLSLCHEIGGLCENSPWSLSAATAGGLRGSTPKRQSWII